MKTVFWASAASCCLAVAGTTMAGPIVGFSSDAGQGTPRAGTVTSYDWDGGNAGGFGTPGTLEAAMRYAASESGNFGGSMFRSRGVNIFLVDFTGDNTYGDAGLTIFVMWGNGVDVGPFAAEAQVSPIVDEGTDGNFNNNVSEIFALGSGVTIDTNGPVTIDVDVDNNETPVGYAITNFPKSFPDLRVNQQWTLTGSINRIMLFGQGEGIVWRGVDDDGHDRYFTDGLVLIIPAPPAALLGLAGLTGVALVGRRRKLVS